LSLLITAKTSAAASAGGDDNDATIGFLKSVFLQQLLWVGLGP